MARTARQDLDYFPMDVYFDQDDKIKLIESEFGNQATSLYFKLLARIYREKGYWKEWDSDIEMLFARDINEQHTYVHEVIKGCLRRGLFNQSVFKAFSVLTSAAIQERYIDIVNQLGRIDVVIVSEYWVHEKPLDRYSRINPDVISISSDEKAKTSRGNDLKESKRKENKESNNPIAGARESADGVDIPDWEEFWRYAQMKAYHEDFARHIYEDLMSSGWRDHLDRVVRNWQNYLNKQHKYQQKWLRNQQNDEANNASNRSGRKTKGDRRIENLERYQ